jgi:hypothetical protein
MSSIWVLLEVGALGALLILVCVAAFARQKEVPAGDEGRRDVDAEPEWWPDFEREFARYVARTTPRPNGGDRGDTAPAPPHDRLN